MATLPADFVYHNFWQFNAIRYAANGGNDAGDCGPASVGCALDIASMGDFDAGIRPYGSTNFGPNPRDAQNRKRADLLVLIRKRGGAPPFGGTSVEAARLAFLTFGAEFAAVNRTPPAARKLYPANWTTDLLPDLVAGRFAQLGVWRGPIQPYLGADPFTGKHAIVIGNYDSGAGTVTVFDPILDGHAAGYFVGPHTVALSHVKAASDAYTPGTNASSANVVYGYSFSPRPQIVTGGGQTITAISAANPTHVTTAAAHGLSTNDWVLIAGTNSTPHLTGPYQVTVLDSTHFTVAVNVSGSGSAGTWNPADPPGVGTGEVLTDPCAESG